MKNKNKGIDVTIAYLVQVYTVVQGPHRLEVILHPLLQLLGDLVESEEILQIPPFSVEQRTSRVYPLNDGRHVSEDHCVHQG